MLKEARAPDSDPRSYTGEIFLAAKHRWGWQMGTARRVPGKRQL